MKKRDASAVMLVRGTGEALEVFLAERSPELRFFGGYWALPGGVRGPEDGPDDESGDTNALLRCGIRELFEETGVLVDTGLLAATSETERQELRQRMLDAEQTDAPSPWLEVEEHLRHDGIREICRIATPPFAPVRYDTVFALTELPEGQEPHIIEGELCDGRFWRPADALDAWHRGEIRIVPPVLILLERLVDGDIDAFLTRAAETANGYANGRMHQVRFSPGVVLAPVRTPTLPPATTTNCLIVGHETLWIIDPASPEESEQQRLAALLDELLASGPEHRKLGGILVTHHHPDHIGGVVALSHQYDLEVRAHPRTMERLPEGFRAGAPMHDDDTIDLGSTPDGRDGWQLQAIYTPGHDQGHLAFRENRYDACLVADMLSTVSTIVIDPPEGHLRTYLESLEKLLEQPISTLYPSHGPAVPDGHKLVRRYLRHRGQRETSLIKALREQGPATARELVPTVYWDTDERMYPLASRSLEAGLQKLVEDGVARSLSEHRYEAVE